MRKHFHYAYKQHHVREKLTFFLIVCSFLLMDLANLIIYGTDALSMICKRFQNEANIGDIDIELNKRGFDKVCDYRVPSISCYYVTTPFFCAIYALPAILFVAVAKPHDCFNCLSIRPETRIANFQYSWED